MPSIVPLFLSITLVQGDSVDVLIRRGTVYDGSLAAPRVTDVAIRGDRIVLVGDAAPSCTSIA